MPPASKKQKRAEPPPPGSAAGATSYAQPAGAGGEKQRKETRERTGLDVPAVKDWLRARSRWSRTRGSDVNALQVGLRGKEG